MRIYGINPVVEALPGKRVTALRVSLRADDRLNEVVRLAEQQGIPVRRAKGDELDRFAKGGTHQGIVADVQDAAHLSVEDLVMGARGAPLIVVLDQIEDPQNVGAILRTVDAAGGDGVIRQSHPPCAGSPRRSLDPSSDHRPRSSALPLPPSPDPRRSDAAPPARS